MAVDKRASAAFNIFYGNRTVTSTLDYKWAKYGASRGYFYGEAIQVLFSTLGYKDFGVLTRELYTQFEIALPNIAEPSAVITNFADFLSKWVHVSVRNIQQERFTSSDVLVLVDISETDALYQISLDRARNIVNANGKVILISQPGINSPVRLCSLDRTVGLQTPILMPFLEAAIDQSLAWFAPERIFVLGSSLRTVTTAMSALDHLLFHQTGKDHWLTTAPRVIVHNNSASLGHSVHSFADICKALRLPATNTLSGASFKSLRDAVYLTAVQ